MSFSCANESTTEGLEVRSGHVSVFYDGCLLVLGGYKSTETHELDDFFSMDVLWMFHIQSCKWRTQNLKGIYLVYVFFKQK